jgi:DNA-binding NarL/FixJ family response regulator
MDRLLLDSMFFEKLPSPLNEPISNSLKTRGKLVRRWLKMPLDSHPGWKVCGEAHSGRETVTIAEELRSDIAIIDISMPELNAIEAARKLRNFRRTRRC